MGSTVPEDILLLFFDLVAHPAPLPWPDAVYDCERATAPFTLASVCPRWRTVAISTAGLWNYFGFPDLDRAQETHLPRLRILLARSGETEVDVVAYWPLTVMPAITEIVDAIGKIAPRWRHVNISASATYATAFSEAFRQQVLRRQWPCLRSLSLSLPTKIVELPLAPRLTSLYISSSNLECLDALPVSIPNLTRLSIFSVRSSITDQTLLAFAQQLTELCILSSTSALPEQLILLPRLHSLTLAKPSYLEHIRAPSLHTLTFRINDAIARDLLVQINPSSAHCISVRHLCIYGPLVEELVFSLRCFTNVVQLTVNSSSHVRRTWPTVTGFRIYPQFFAALRFSRSDSMPAWPRLKRIHLGRLDDSRMDFARELINFVVFRNVTHESYNTPEDAGALRPDKIEAVTMGFEGAPEWFVSELRRLFPPALCRSSSSQTL
ncbi:hypothetical protein BKA62DRAFT_385198 [Auriculariales sp. MPI-PUGE-AT-0066]|nr:hypothetical protein BKA62DRAFT_385198 [Auriculariales sp. MPI-PUGE-AT-0066]